MNQTLSNSSALAVPQTLLALYSRYGEWLPRIVALLLVVLLARTAADLLWSLVPTPAAAWQPPPAPPVAAAARTGVDIAKIASSELFGKYLPPAKASAADLARAPDTQLDLKLKGIFAGDEKYSRALIATQDGDERPYAVGDAIGGGGVKVQAIFPDRVVLLRNGRPELLRLDKDRTDANQLAVDDGDSGDNEDEDPEPMSPEEGAMVAQINAIRLSDIRDEMLADPSKASQFIRLQPMNAGGGLHGYRVFPGPNRALFMGTGLRPGDVVTSVNGVELNDPARALQMLGDLAHTNDLNVVVNRGGTSTTIRLSVNN
jgi:general secretion pathway protein C